MITGPKLENRTEQPYAAIRTQVTMQELGTGVIPRLHREVIEWLGKQGLSPVGAPFIRYLVINMADKLDIELGWPTAQVLASDSHVSTGALPAGHYASLIYTGDYSGLMNANAVLLDWGKEKGLKWDSWTSDNGDEFRARFETYLTDPGEELNPDKWETEVAIRLADVQAQ